MVKKKNTLNQVVYFKTLPQCFLYMQETYRNKNAVTFYTEEGEEITRTYQQLSEDVRALVRAFSLHGFHGRHLAIVSENRYEWIVAFWAGVCSGCTVIPIDIEQPPQVLGEMIEHADAEVVLVSEEVSLAADVSGYAPHIIYMKEEEHSQMLTFSKLLGEGRDSISLDADEICEVGPEQEAVIIYTSGTTSTAKPVILTHENIMYNACTALAMVEVKEKLFTPLPLYHTYALVCAMIGCLSQGRHFAANESLKTLMRDVRRFDADTLIGVPMIADALLKAIVTEEKKAGVREEIEAKIENQFRRKLWIFSLNASKNPEQNRNQFVEKILGSRLSLIVSGGAHLNEKTAEEFEYYGIQLLQGYGISECSPLISTNQTEGNRRKSVGRVLPGTEVRFENGEILVKGPSVFKGYYKSEELTEESLQDGWFCTGDIGYMDKDGYLYICGRKKNLIVFSNGKKLVPEELEQQLLELPIIEEVMVYGANSGQTADEVKLSVLVYPDKEYTGEMSSFEILEKLQEDIGELNKKLPMYKRIQSVKISESEFGKTSMKKMKRSGEGL